VQIEHRFIGKLNYICNGLRSENQVCDYWICLVRRLLLPNVVLGFVHCGGSFLFGATVGFGKKVGNSGPKRENEKTFFVFKFSVAIFAAVKVGEL
jgi:hypothetical protein